MRIATDIRRSVVAVLLAVSAVAGRAEAQDGGRQAAPPVAVLAPIEWPTDLVDAFAVLPIQEGGRIKPLATYARFQLLAINGKTSVKMPKGFTPASRPAMEWLLDCLFFPAVASTQRCFQVIDDEVLHGVGYGVEGRRKRDWYSYLELLPVRAALMQRADEFKDVEPKMRSTVQVQTLRLASGILDFEYAIHALDIGREAIDVTAVPAVSKLFDGKEHIRFSEAVAKALQLGMLYQSQQTASGAVDADLNRVISHIEMLGARAGALHLFPPEDPALDTWMSPGGILDAALSDQPVAQSVDDLVRLEQLATLCRDGGSDPAGPGFIDEAAFRTQLTTLQDGLVGRARAREEYRKVATEVAFYKGKFFFFNPWFFLVGFLLVAGAWLAPARTSLVKAAWVVTTVSVALLTTGVVLRCVIRERPPVSTLYETILFIAAVGVIVCLITEAINRRRIALGVAAFMGMAGMFLANKYELHEAVDTMPTLQAVLDTNFWLATHVTSVTVGYSAGLFASALAHVHLIYLMLRRRGGGTEFGRSMGRMVYGLLCFGLLFSTVGTILGGIWANDSWGRFWGWDPKENGALMIVLAELMVLHGRLGGYLREIGVSVGAVLAGLVVVFSWWGVNLLGVGLHSYGFTAGAALAVRWFQYFEYAFLAVWAVYWLVFLRGGKAPGPSSIATEA